MKDSSLQCIIFDIGGVLEFHDKESFFQEFATEIQVHPSDFAEAYERFEYLHDTDAIGADAFVSGISERVGVDLSTAVFYESYFKYVRLNTPLLEFIDAELKQYVPLFVMSNNCRANVQHTRSHIDLDATFQHCVFSYDLRAKKPSLHFFEPAFLRIQHAPNDCLVIDDKVSNVQVAASLGAEVHLFTTNRNLFEHLRAYCRLT